MTTQTIKVWDPIVRLGHWTLVMAFFTAYFTEDELMTQHVWAGYIVGAVVMFRLVWGLIGSKHARFSDFIYTPKAIIGYLTGLIKRKAQHYVGHNPAGGAMVIALLISLCGTVYSGCELYAVEEHAGPLANMIGQQASISSSVITSAVASESDEKLSDVNEQNEAFWEGLHEFFANFTLLLVALHVSGVLLSSLIDRENLIKAMITGRKDKHTD